MTGVLMLSLAACTSAGESTTTEDADISAQVDQALEEIEGVVLSTGPHGEEAAPAESAELTPEEVEQVQALGATAAIVMHYGGNDWANAQVAGLEEEFARLGIEVVAVTDANFDPGTQVSNIETVMARDPDIIVSIPTDPVATASAYQRAADAGIELVFMDNAPDGLVAGEDYVSVVSSDNYGNGVVSAHLMAKALGGTGQIAALYHEADFFVTEQRFQGFKDTIESDYPDIEVIAERGIAEPDLAGSAQSQADALLSQNPDLRGIWAPWDVPAEGVMAAARSAGRADLVITTVDLGKNVAIAIAQNQMVAGLGAQLPMEQGRIEARLGAGALIGKEAPPYVAVSALPVDHDNVLEAWEQVYGTAAPDDLQQAYDAAE
ncbi:substrate-binding domain-containing protein [Georgenia muralis]